MGDQTLDGPVFARAVAAFDDDEHALAFFDERALQFHQLDLERAELALVVAVAVVVVIIVVDHRGSLMQQRAGNHPRPRSNRTDEAPY